MKTVPTPPSSIRQLMRRLRRQIRRYVGLEGLAIAVIWLGLAFWVGLALDYLPVLAGSDEMPRTARFVLLAIISFVLAFLVYRFVIRRIFTRLADRSLALLLERRFPQLEDALVTTVDTTLDENDAALAERQAAMLQHAIEAAVDRSRGIDSRQVLTYRPLWSKGLVALLAVVSILLLGFFARDTFATWTQRMLLLTDDPWPRRAHIELLDFPEGERKVAEGSDLTIRVRADANRPTPPPSVCTIDYRLADGSRGRVNMSRDGEPRDGFQYYRYQGPPFHGMLDSLTFDVVGFDHRLRDKVINVVARPSILNVTLDCQLPAYMNQPPRSLSWRPGTSLPAGTDIQLTIDVTKPLRQVTITATEANQRDVLEFAPGEAPVVFHYSMGPLTETSVFQFELLDLDQVPSQEPYQVTIQALEDAPPKVDIDLVGIGTSITPEANLPIRGTIVDDYGIRDAWFQLDRAADGQQQRVELLLGRNGEVEQSLDLRQLRNEGQLSFDVETGDQLVFSIQSRDDYDLEGNENVGQSEPYSLNVVSSQELLALLEARELSLKRRFEQTISEMTDTRDSLLRLQASLAESTTNAVTDQNDSSGETNANSPTAQRDASLSRLRVQRAHQLGVKSQQEVQGVAAAFADVRDELINNRVDTPEHRDRLQDQIIEPLETIVADDFPQWLDQLTYLEDRVTHKPQTASVDVAKTVELTNDLILALQQVLEKMLELETYNELLDLFRSVLNEQEAIQEKTDRERKRLERALLEEFE